MSFTMPSISHYLVPLGLALLFAPDAFSADTSAEPSLVVNATLASQYVSRGIGQSWGQPA